MKSHGNVDVYNIQYEGAVASASCEESVDEVLARLEPDMLRFVLPRFSGLGQSVEVNHREGRMTAHAAEFDSLGPLRGLWLSMFPDKSSSSYGLTCRGRFQSRNLFQRFLHFLVQCASIGASPAAEQLAHFDLRCVGATGSHEEGPIERFELSGALLPCSDCGGCHHPAVASAMWKSVRSIDFGSCEIELNDAPDEVEAQIALHSLSYEFSFDSEQLERAREALHFARLLDF